MSGRALTLSPLGFGTMAVGGQYADVSDGQATAAIRTALANGITFFDTAPQYGCGLAEERLGRALRGAPRESVAIASKVGKRIVPVGSGGQRQREIFFPGGHDAEMVFDYSYDGTFATIDGSLQRLGMDRIDLVLIHDVIRHFHGEDGVHEVATQAINGTVRALHRLREEGVVGAIGTGLKDVDIAARFIEEADIDAVLVPGRLTLLDQSALHEGLLDLCAKHGVAYIAASPFDSGILATGPRAGTTYGYRPPSGEIVARVETIMRVAADHDVPLAAAALQYPGRFPAVASVLSGMRTADEVAANARLMQLALPDTLWPALHAAAGVPLPEMPST